jgi:hypothetical protein
MTILEQHKGLLIFGLTAVILLIVAFAAYQATGPMGIEERFNTAAGISSDGGYAGKGAAGFFIEGNALTYLIVIFALVIACAAIYWRFRE